MQLYLLTALLYPDNIAEYDGYGDYFLKRRAWFFGLIASVQVFDVVDTLIKGENHASQYHWTYWAQDGGIALCRSPQWRSPTAASSSPSQP